MAALLRDTPSFLDDCLQTLFPPEDMKAVLEHHRNLGHFKEKGTAGAHWWEIIALHRVLKRVARKARSSAALEMWREGVLRFIN